MGGIHGVVRSRGQQDGAPEQRGDRRMKPPERAANENYVLVARVVVAGSRAMRSVALHSRTRTPTSFFLCPRTCHIQRGLASASFAAPPAPVLRLARTPAVPLFRARTTICRREIKRQRAGPLLHARQAILHREIDLCHPPATFVVAPPSSRRRHGFRPRALPRGLLNFRGSPLSCPRGNRTSQGAACGTSV
jgi:hypothetical protein